MAEGDTGLITLAISPAQIISAVKNMEKEQQASFVEDLLAATSPEYLASIHEAREDYRTGRIDSDKQVAGIRQAIVYPGEDGYWVVECPSLPGCISQGKTRDEAISNIKEAMELYIEVLREQGEPIPEDRLEMVMV